MLRGVAPVPQQRYIQHAVCPGRRTSLGEVIEKLGNAGHLFGVPRLPDNLATHHNQVNVEVDRKELVEIAADYAAAGTSLHLLGIDSGRGGATGPYLRIVRSSTIRRSKRNNRAQLLRLDGHLLFFSELSQESFRGLALRGTQRRICLEPGDCLISSIGQHSEIHEYQIGTGGARLV